MLDSAGAEVIFFAATGMGLCCGFVLNTGLIIFDIFVIAEQ